MGVRSLVTTFSGSAAVTPSDIAVTGVSRSFGSVLALRGATLTVPAGSVTALIGPNGSGKTTLLLILATLLTLDTGTIRINGHDLVTEPERVRAIMGWMPDTQGSWPSLSASADHRPHVPHDRRAGRRARPHPRDPPPAVASRSPAGG